MQHSKSSLRGHPIKLEHSKSTTTRQAPTSEEQTTESRRCEKASFVPSKSRERLAVTSRQNYDQDRPSYLSVRSSSGTRLRGHGWLYAILQPHTGRRPSTPMAIVNPNERLTTYIPDPADQPQPLVRVASQVSPAQRSRAGRPRSLHFLPSSLALHPCPWKLARVRYGRTPHTAGRRERTEKDLDHELTSGSLLVVVFKYRRDDENHTTLP
jgi:hypothetical protein